MHLQNIACAVFAIKGMGKGLPLAAAAGGGWWASMCFPIDIKQSSDMEMGGQRKNGFSLRLCLDIGQGLSLPPSLRLSIHPSLSPTAHRRCHHFSIS